MLVSGFGGMPSQKIRREHDAFVSRIATRCLPSRLPSEWPEPTLSGYPPGRQIDLQPPRGMKR